MRKSAHSKLSSTHTSHTGHAVPQGSERSKRSSSKYSDRSIHDSIGNNLDAQFRKLDLSIIDDTILGFLANPIQSGYLLKFSHSEYNAENMVYVLEIDKFKDLCVDVKVWDNSLAYKAFDSNIDNFDNIQLQENDLIFGICSEREWPSKRIPYSSFREHAKKIWDTYLASTAIHQIFMPARVLSNTIHRLKYLHVYGNKVFDETLIDPVKTLNTDVRPRFLTSPHYRAMLRRLKELNPLPTRFTLQIRTPSKSACLEWDDDKCSIENLREVPMVDLFHDKILYEEFLKFCKKIYADENVYFARAVSIFKCYFDHADPVILAQGKVPPEADDQAWFIFRYFIAPGSSYEVSGISHIIIKDIMHNLAHPHRDMFVTLESSILRLVRNQYVDFSFTKEFNAIPTTIFAKAYEKQFEKRLARQRAKQEKEQKLKNQLNIGCFGFR